MKICDSCKEGPRPAEPGLHEGDPVSSFLLMVTSQYDPRVELNRETRVDLRGAVELHDNCAKKLAAAIKKTVLEEIGVELEGLSPAIP